MSALPLPDDRSRLVRIIELSDKAGSEVQRAMEAVRVAKECKARLHQRFGESFETCDFGRWYSMANREQIKLAEEEMEALEEAGRTLSALSRQVSTPRIGIWPYLDLAAVGLPPDWGGVVSLATSANAETLFQQALPRMLAALYDLHDAAAAKLSRLDSRTRSSSGALPTGEINLPAPAPSGSNTPEPAARDGQVTGYVVAPKNPPPLDIPLETADGSRHVIRLDSATLTFGGMTLLLRRLTELSGEILKAPTPALQDALGYCVGLLHSAPGFDRFAEWSNIEIGCVPCADAAEKLRARLSQQLRMPFGKIDLMTVVEVMHLVDAAKPPETNAASQPAAGIKPIEALAEPLVILGQPGDEPTVNGKRKPKLSKPRRDVVSVLLAAGDDGLSKDSLANESGHGDANRILDRLSKSDPDWGSVIQMAGEPGGRYRIRRTILPISHDNSRKAPTKRNKG